MTSMAYVLCGLWSKTPILQNYAIIFVSMTRMKVCVHVVFTQKPEEPNQYSLLTF